MRRLISESHKQDAPDTMSTSGPAGGCMTMVRVLPERVTMPEQLPFTYVPNYVPDADALFARLREGLDWVHREGTPGLATVLCRLTERFKLTSGEARNHGSDAHRRIPP